MFSNHLDLRIYQPQPCGILYIVFFFKNIIVLYQLQKEGKSIYFSKAPQYLHLKWSPYVHDVVIYTVLQLHLTKTVSHWQCVHPNCGNNFQSSVCLSLPVKTQQSFGMNQNIAQLYFFFQVSLVIQYQHRQKYQMLMVISDSLPQTNTAPDQHQYYSRPTIAQLPGYVILLASAVL